MAKSDAIITLYKSIESGYSQCHHTGNNKKASGGWYVEHFYKSSFAIFIITWSLSSINSIHTFIMVSKVQIFLSLRQIIIIQCLNCRYFEICPHGCIICAKKMFLAESTRDPIDIKKSKEYNSPSNFLGLHLLSCKIDLHCSNILDTPRTAASNLATRDPDLHKLW